MTIKEMLQIKENRGYSYSQLSEYTGVPSITLQKIFTGKTCERQLEKIRSRTGHITKKMIEDYENKIK